MDIIKQTTQKLQEYSTQKFDKSEDLNSTHWEKHPMELIEAQSYDKTKLIVNSQFYQLNEVCLSLRETEQGQKFSEYKDQLDSFVTDQLKKRIKKEAKYSSLETLTMRMLKQRKIYVGSKNLAKKIKIAEQKNYAIIALRLGYLYHYSRKNFGKSKEQTICWMFSYLTQNLEDCIKHKYLINNSEAFVNLVKVKNMSDLAVFRKAMESNFQCFELVNEKIQGLYEKKQDGNPSLKNQKFCENVTEVLMGVILKGSAFRFGNQIQIRKQFLQKNKIEASNKMTGKMVEFSELSLTAESFSQLICLEMHNEKRQRSKYTIQLFDLTCPQQMDKYLRREYDTNTDLEFYSYRKYEDSFMAM